MTFYSKIILLFSLFYIFTQSDVLGFVENFNSFTLSGKLHNYSARVEGAEYESREEFSGLSFAIKSIQHPSLYKNGSFNYKLSPAVNFTRLALRPSQFEKDQNPDLLDANIRRLVFLANLKATVHTRLGQFIGAVGYGPALYRIDYQGDNSAKYPLKDIIRLEAVNVSFLNDTFFIYAGPRVYLDGGTHFVWSIRLGMYWGEVADLVGQED